MSTRANVVIIKEGYSPVFLYHHHDGYPSGVGQGITEYAKELLGMDEKTRKEITSTPMKLGKWLTDDERDDEYEFTNMLHSDIEYLYLIDLDGDAVVCYDAWNWDEKISQETALKGGNDLPLQYAACLWDAWSEVENEIKKCLSD